MHRALSPALVALALVAGCHADERPAVNLPDAARPPSSDAPPPVSDDWSPIVDGVRGRLVITETRDEEGRAELAIDVELDNVEAASKEVLWGSPSDNVKLALKDEAGNELPASAPGGSWADAPRYVALPHGVTRINITKRAYEYVPGRGPWLRPTTFQAWTLPAKGAGKLYLHARLVPQPNADPKHHPWAGALTLPRAVLP